MRMRVRVCVCVCVCVCGSGFMCFFINEGEWEREREREGENYLFRTHISRLKSCAWAAVRSIGSYVTVSSVYALHNKKNTKCHVSSRRVTVKHGRTQNFTMDGGSQWHRCPEIFERRAEAGVLGTEVPQRPKQNVMLMNKFWRSSVENLEFKSEKVETNCVAMWRFPL